MIQKTYIFIILGAFFGIFCSAVSFPPVAFARDCSQAATLMNEGIAKSDGSAAEEKMYRRALELCPEMASAHYNLAVVALRRGDIDEARKSAAKALELEKSLNFILGLADIELRLGEFEKAKELYEKALAEQPALARALEGLSVIAGRKGNDSQAIKLLKRAVEADPDSFTAHFNLAVLEERAGRAESALEQYQKARALNRNSYEAAFYLGLLLQKMGRYGESAEVLAAAARLDDKNIEVFRALAKAHQGLQDFDQAEFALENALSLNPDDVPALINIGVVLIEKNREALAEERLLRAVELAPGNSPESAQALSVLGWAQLKLGKYSEAERALQQALRKDARDAVARNNLGVVYQRLGKKEAAQKEFEAALQLDPNLDAAKENLERFGYSATR